MIDSMKRFAPVLSGVAILAMPCAVSAETTETSSAPIGPGRLKPPKEARIQTDNVAQPSKLSQLARAKQVGGPSEDSFSQYNGKTVSNIRVEGLTSVDASTVLQSLKVQPGVKLTAEAVQKDVNMLYNLGYFQNVTPAFRFARGKDGKADELAEVMYFVTENPMIKDIDIQGSTVLNKFGLARALNLGNTAVPNIREIAAKLKGVEEEYKKNGYVLARVTGVSITPDGILHITVDEGKISGFTITGNKRTKNYVIERELRQKPGDSFNTALMQRSVQRLYNLGLFEDVEMKLGEGKEPGTYEVIIEVEEANTATIGLGAGYSDSNGVTGQITLEDRNLFGTGDSASIRWEFGGKDKANYDFSYTKPWLDKKETRMTVSLYQGTHERTDYNRDGNEIANYDKKSTGQEITFSRAEGEFVRNAITLKHRDDKYRGPEGGGLQYYEPGYQGQTYGKTVEERRRENFGETRAIAFTRTYDSRDNVFDPHHGKRNSYTFEFAGFGGDFNYKKLSVDYRYYWELGKNKDVLALNMAAGYAWGDMPLSQRFSVGGSNTLRGYRDDQFRGNSMLRASLEYRYPVAKKVSLVAFVDTGYAWDKRDERRFDLSKMKAGFGVGIRFQSPIGPVRLDYGIGEQKRFHFSFGASF